MERRPRAERAAAESKSAAGPQLCGPAALSAPFPDAVTAVGKIQSRKAGLSSSQNTTEKRSEKRRTRLVSGKISRSAGESIHDSHTYSASAKSGKYFGKNAFAAATEASTAPSERSASAGMCKKMRRLSPPAGFPPNAAPSVISYSSAPRRNSLSAS